MNKLIFASYCLIPFLSIGQHQHRNYEDSSIKCTYEQRQGRLDGNYRSYYQNGQKKAVGTFENNYRTGNWTLWDSAGKICVQRVYSTPFNFNQLFPVDSSGKTTESSNFSYYSLQYNKEGFMEYFKLKEAMIVWAKRIWRLITPAENPLLFDKNELFSMLSKCIMNKTIIPYQTTDDEFRKELAMTEMDTAAIKVIGYKIKEDCFFDSERSVFESRIIGLCPVAVNKLKHDTIDLYWIYFPQVRTLLAQRKVQQAGVPEKIKTMDDLFFYRYFSGQIYKESNVYDQPIAAYKKGDEVKREAERIEVSLIEAEHDLWMKLIH